MKIEELIEGEIYKLSNCGYIWTFRCTDKKKAMNIYLEVSSESKKWNKEYGDVNSNTNPFNQDYKIPSEREKQIFLASEAAGKYTEPAVEQINNTYLIY